MELLALVWVITEKFKEYLTGAKIEVFMDNNPFVLETAKLGALEQRWVTLLAHFNYKIHFKPEKFKGHLDAHVKMWTWVGRTCYASGHLILLFQALTTGSPGWSH